MQNMKSTAPGNIRYSAMITLARINHIPAGLHNIFAIATSRTNAPA